MLQHDPQGKPLFVHHNQLKRTHLPWGENFKYMKTPSLTGGSRAVPVNGMDLVGGRKLSCTDIDGVNLRNVDPPSREVTLAHLEDFEVKYLDTQEKISSSFTPAERQDGRGMKLERRALSDNVTNNCPSGQFE